MSTTPYFISVQQYPVAGNLSCYLANTHIFTHILSPERALIR